MSNENEKKNVRVKLKEIKNLKVKDQKFGNDPPSPLDAPCKGRI